MDEGLVAWHLSRKDLADLYSQTLERAVFLNSPFILIFPISTSEHCNTPVLIP